MLEIDHLTVRFGATAAVDDVSLVVPTGQVCALLGPSGSGKSTLLRAVAGLVRPDAGTISYDGRSLAGVPVHKRGFALMFQDGQLFNHQSVGRNIAYPLRLRHESRGRIAQRVSELLELVGLPAAGDRMPDTLSGGERQRMAIARLLLKAPPIVVLDEATAHLDSESEAAVQRALDGALEGRTSLVIAHRLSTVRNADQILVIDDGRVVQRGTHSDLLAAGGMYADLHRTQYFQE